MAPMESQEGEINGKAKLVFHFEGMIACGGPRV
jgi:hypothetical protein